MNDDGAGPPRLWRLMPIQYRHAMMAIFRGRGALGSWQVEWPPNIDTETPFEGINGGDRFVNYSRAFTMNDSEYWRALEAADHFARQLVPQLLSGGGCLGKATASTLADACVRSVVSDFGQVAFGRPLSDAEIGRYGGVAIANELTLGKTEAMVLALQALFASPNFLYRGEGVAGVPDSSGLVKLTSFELASALSYALTDSPPDQALWTAAVQGKLDTHDEIAGHVERLLMFKPSKFGVSPIVRFFQEYTHYPKAISVFKSSARPVFGDARNVEYLVSDTNAWFADMISANGRVGFWKEFLTSGTAFVRGSYTGPFFGLDLPQTKGSGTKMNLDPGQRAGFLTHPAFLTAFSVNDETEPVQRGKFVRESLLCGEVPPLPISQVPKLPDLGPNATARDKLKVHSEMGGCWACHRFMDPLGLPFEIYDDVGRLRTTEHGTTIDASGELTGAGATDGKFQGVVELARKLVQTPVASRCFVRHAFQYWLGRSAEGYDERTLGRMHDAFVNNEGDLVGMLTTLFSSKTYLYRCGR